MGVLHVCLSPHFQQLKAGSLGVGLCSTAGARQVGKWAYGFMCTVLTVCFAKGVHGPELPTAVVVA